MPPRPNPLLGSPSSPTLASPQTKPKNETSRLPTLSGSSSGTRTPTTNDPFAAQINQIKIRRSHLLGTSDERPTNRPIESPSAKLTARSKSVASMDTARFGESSVAELEPFLRAKSVSRPHCLPFVLSIMH